MKNYLAVMVFLISAQAAAVSMNDNAEILHLDKPYTITHLKFLDVDCVWTRDEKGRLNSEALGPNSSGVCWDEKAVAQVEKLDREKKLIWHEPPKFDYEYGDKNKCYYKVDREGGFVDYELGDVTSYEREDCIKKSSKEKALSLATKIEKKVSFGGYVTTQKDIFGSVLLACYTGSLDSEGMLYVSKEEQENRYKALLGLYEGQPAIAKRITNAFNFARQNLSDRYPLDTMGQYRAGVCDQMVMKGKL
ncbi:hypothetical protein [Pseudomonas protegens]|uniref:hypothetical protein n=1 Tax=Pseudomonas protegens TaxID=380021 RepID=UPI001B315B4B|nr:hypothetical protein [Pseudomonas protegens]MBP5098285.1 hypothetical protein [Pseudomonas protegens]MBP5126894.1 hypothetical protein [Pseudomonas protegens]QTU06157.1 hypothetical protein HUT25_10525 [Pseudomonas protegens]QTU12467.1 hypothetical protein HUT23_11215 [Pseudomonas protegens]QTU40155.1 hypothetical protein HUT24_21090 [Pseudomonas protegens]